MTHMIIVELLDLWLAPTPLFWFVKQLPHLHVIQLPSNNLLIQGMGFNSVVFGAKFLGKNVKIRRFTK